MYWSRQFVIFSCWNFLLSFLTFLKYVEDEKTNTTLKNISSHFYDFFTISLNDIFIIFSQTCRSFVEVLTPFKWFPLRVRERLLTCDIYVLLQSISSPVLRPVHYRLILDTSWFSTSSNFLLTRYWVKWTRYVDKHE